MNLEQKLAVDDQLASIDCRADLSGGEVMANKDKHLQLLERLTLGLGKENIGLSCSGWGIDEKTAKKLASVTGNVEMTMDSHPNADFIHRPKGYHLSSNRCT